MTVHFMFRSLSVSHLKALKHLKHSSPTFKTLRLTWISAKTQATGQTPWWHLFSRCTVPPFYRIVHKVGSQMTISYWSLMDNSIRSVSSSILSIKVEKNNLKRTVWINWHYNLESFTYTRTDFDGEKYLRFGRFALCLWIFLTLP